LDVLAEWQKQQFTGSPATVNILDALMPLIPVSFPKTPAHQV
jgi:hypothetical protein